MEEEKLLPFLVVCLITLLMSITAVSTNISASEVNKTLDQEAIKWAKELASKPLPTLVLNDVQELHKDSLAIIKEELGIEDKVNANNTKIFYIFVSLSIPPKNLKFIALEARNHGATLVLRGLKENSYQKTAQYLQKLISETGIGMIIDPTLFTKYSVNVVPTFVLAAKEEICPSNMNCKPGRFDKLTGNVTAKFAFEKFQKEGEAW
jgi:type-F conjugative transfer system pilin assembly protein TrbC